MLQCKTTEKTVHIEQTFSLEAATFGVNLIICTGTKNPEFLKRRQDWYDASANLKFCICYVYIPINHILEFQLYLLT